MDSQTRLGAAKGRRPRRSLKKGHSQSSACRGSFIDRLLSLPLHTSWPGALPVSGSRNMLSKRFEDRAHIRFSLQRGLLSLSNLTLFGWCHVYGACAGRWKCEDTCAVRVCRWRRYAVSGDLEWHIGLQVRHIV